MDQKAQARIDQVLVALHAAPLDRIRLMKTIFLTWYRMGKPSDAPFLFTPYLYGPVSFEVYTTLNQMEQRGLIVQAPNYFRNWAQYYLTEAGKEEAKAAARRQDSEAVKLLSSTAQWANSMGFRELLNRVYKEAPEYASESVLRAE